MSQDASSTWVPMATTKPSKFGTKRRSWLAQNIRAGNGDVVLVIDESGEIVWVIGITTRLVRPQWLNEFVLLKTAHSDTISIRVPTGLMRPRIRYPCDSLYFLHSNLESCRFTSRTINLTPNRHYMIGMTLAWYKALPSSPPLRPSQGVPISSPILSPFDPLPADEQALLQDMIAEGNTKICSGRVLASD